MSEIENPKKKSTGKMIAFGCLALLVAGAVGIGGLFLGVTKLLKTNVPYKDAIAAVESNPAAIAVLGEPVKPGLFPSGSISVNNGEGEVSFRIPVSGPNGSGTIHVEGGKAAGSPAWNYTTLELRVEGNPDPIPLAN